MLQIATTLPFSSPFGRNLVEEKPQVAKAKQKVRFLRVDYQKFAVSMFFTLLSGPR